MLVAADISPVKTGKGISRELIRTQRAGRTIPAIGRDRRTAPTAPQIRGATFHIFSDHPGVTRASRWQSEMIILVSPEHLVGSQKYPTKNGSILSLWVIFWARLFVLTTACTGLRSLFLSYGALNGAKKWPISPKIPLKISHPAHGKLLTLVTPELRSL
jgi:hypothetical protein